MLRESLQYLYEQAPCGYIFTLPDGTIARVNQTFLEWTGYERRELVSNTRFPDLLTRPSRMFYENQYAPLLRMQGFVKGVTLDLLRKDQSSLPVLLNSVQRTDAAGRPLLVASTIFDATDRRRYERELLLERRKAEELAAIVAFSSDAILSASPKGVVQSVNSGGERLFGSPAARIIGVKLRELLAAEGGTAEWDRIEQELREGRPVLAELAAVRPNGGRVEVSAALTPLVGLLGEVGRISAVVRDISERREAERLQQEFLAMVSHEIRHPLTAIKGYAQLMQSRGTYSERAVDTIVEQARRMERLIDDLMVASQLEAQRLDLRLVPTELVEEVRTAVQQMPFEAHPVRLDAPSEPVPVLADPQRLGQVFANLLSNAAKYSPAGSEIAVRITVEGARARVAVTDRGVGIPAEALPHLFTRFYRVEDTAGQATGLGLGLYLSRRLAEAHGGGIDVESEPGAGSTFTVALPLSP